MRFLRLGNLPLKQLRLTEFLQLTQKALLPVRFDTQIDSATRPLRNTSMEQKLRGALGRSCAAPLHPG